MKLRTLGIAAISFERARTVFAVFGRRNVCPAAGVTNI
jgi:hypothetical protein